MLHNARPRNHCARDPLGWVGEEAMHNVRRCFSVLFCVFALAGTTAYADPIFLPDSGSCATTVGACLAITQSSSGTAVAGIHAGSAGAGKGGAGVRGVTKSTDFGA